MSDAKRLRELAEDVLNLKPDFCGGNWRTHYDYEKAANPQAILALIDELEKARELVHELFNQHCGEWKGDVVTYDHGCLSAHEGAQDALIEWKMIKPEQCRRG